MFFFGIRPPGSPSFNHFRFQSPDSKNVKKRPKIIQKVSVYLARKFSNCTPKSVDRCRQPYSPPPQSKMPIQARSNNTALFPPSPPPPSDCPSSRDSNNLGLKDRENATKSPTRRENFQNHKGFRTGIARRRRVNIQLVVLS